MKKIACMLASIYFACGQAAIADEFQKVQCGSDIPKALIGRRSSNERIVVLENRNRKLGLKHLGADETSDQLSSINWLICGAEFVVLEDRQGRVRDVLPFPSHSRRSPAFSGICRVDGRDLPDVMIGVLNGEGATDFLPVQSAWKIDQKNAKFVKASSEGLRCPRNAIYSVDGGR
jgi:hypothetical protein